MKTGIERVLRALFGLSVAAALAFASGLLIYANLELTTGQLPVQFELPQGGSLRSAAQVMERAGLLRHPRVFIVMARLLGEAGNVKAGNYSIDHAPTPYALLRIITEGDVTQHAIKFVEGWTFRQMRK